MTFADLSPWANHLWQSTLCAAVVWLLTLALRKNRAAVRYCVWLAASVKFLIPFSLLVSAGAQLGWRTAPAVVRPQFSYVMEEIAQPFAAPASTPLPAVAAPVLNPMPAILFGVWLCGVAIGVIFWLRWWRQVRAVQRAATPLHLNLPIQVMSSPARLEPGVLGIHKPVLLLPEGIADRLTPPQLEAILAHELRHVQRRDNLTAAIHMVVETLFWFHPLVWWIRARLMEERELACDEGVLRLGSESQVYAESILKVCEFYLASPVACAAGVTGGELKKRIESIMANRIFHKLNFAQKLLLVMAAIGAVGGPIAAGLAGAPRSQSRAQAVAAVAQAPSTAAPAAVTAPPAESNTPGSEGPGTGALRTEHPSQRVAASPAFEVAAQTQPQKAPAAPVAPAFEVASIKRSAMRAGSWCRFLPGGRLSAMVWVKELIELAYSVEDYQVSGGPDWLTSDRYDIEAKAESADAGKSEMTMMLQFLLANRFKLQLRQEVRDFSVYALMIGKSGPKVRPLEEGEVSRCGRDNSFVCGITTIAELAKMLQYSVGRPVLDRTGLDGKFDVLLDFDTYAIRGQTPPPEWDKPSLTTALQEQLGLRLEPQRASFPVLVVESVQRPTEN